MASSSLSPEDNRLVYIKEIFDEEAIPVSRDKKKLSVPQLLSLKVLYLLSSLLSAGPLVIDDALVDRIRNEVPKWKNKDIPYEQERIIGEATRNFGPRFYLYVCSLRIIFAKLGLRLFCMFLVLWDVLQDNRLTGVVFTRQQAQQAEGEDHVINITMIEPTLAKLRGNSEKRVRGLGDFTGVHALKYKGGVSGDVLLEEWLAEARQHIKESREVGASIPPILASIMQSYTSWVATRPPSAVQQGETIATTLLNDADDISSSIGFPEDIYSPLSFVDSFFSPLPFLEGSVHPPSYDSTNNRDESTSSYIGAVFSTFVPFSRIT
eukprot:TRINITY_DN8791_c0_g2_i1.p1 TRINITY_DN8791_c0_g2~~TRINITY_DN8791_c0_g2_i1.p1  ORF type:complete len:322 (-),score=57.84 TRINITY_DN8791_c0_g2_i1:254-1219(-)